MAGWPGLYLLSLRRLPPYNDNKRVREDTEHENVQADEQFQQKYQETKYCLNTEREYQKLRSFRL